MKSEFLTELETRDLDDKNFVLLSPLRYRSKILGGIIECETGFVSDGSSTPRVPIIFWFYGQRAHREGVIHDRIYRAKDHTIRVYQDDGSFVLKKITKSCGDAVYYEGQTVRKKPFIIKYGMYSGVVLGGRSSWKTGNERFLIMENPRTDNLPESWK